MNAPRENDPSELDRFKRDIDLVDYAQRFGYQIQKEGRRGDWQLIEKNEEKLIVTRKGDHQVYKNTENERDSGSVIDFVKTRGGDGQGMNLGQVRQELRGYLDGNPAPAREYGPPVDVSRLNALPVGDPNRDRQLEEDRKTQMIAEVLGVKKELTDRTYLHSRGITDSTIDNPAFQGRIFTAQQNEFKNTAFPLYNEQGLASVEQKNQEYKNLLELPKNGIWVSHPTEGKDTKVDRIVVSESAVDSLSHHQLKHGQDQKNTMYIATSGQPTEAQIALIQRVIDKQEPKEVILANDNDAGGRKFNINYLNELQPARPLTPVADLEAYKEATRPIDWHATSDKYHMGLKVTYHHDGPEQKAQQVQQLTDRVEKINSTQEAGPSVALEVQRSNDRETVLRLSVARTDTAQLEVVAQELYRQRTQLRPEQERQQQQPLSIRVDYPVAKDWNRDLELTQQGLTPEQIRAQAQRDEQQREAERQQREQQREAERQQRREADRQTGRAASPAEQQLVDAFEANNKTETRIAQTIAAIRSPDGNVRDEQHREAERQPQRVAEKEQQVEQQPAINPRLEAEYAVSAAMERSEQENQRKYAETQRNAKEFNEKLINGVPASAENVNVQPQRVAEKEQQVERQPAINPRLQAEYDISDAMYRAEIENERKYAEIQRKAKEFRESLEQGTLSNAAVPTAAAGSPDQGPQSQFRSYRSEQEAREQTAQFTALREGGVVLLKDWMNDNPPPTGRRVDEAQLEDSRDRARYAEPGPALSLPTTPVVEGKPIEEKVVAEDKVATWHVDELTPNSTGRAEAWKEVLESSGYIKTGEIRSSVDEQGIRSAEFDMRYRNDQPEIAFTHAIVENTKARIEGFHEKYEGISISESPQDRAERQDAASRAEMQPPTNERAAELLYKLREPERQEIAADLRGEQRVDWSRMDEPPATPYWYGEAGKTPTAKEYLEGKEGEALTTPPPSTTSEERYLLINTTGHDNLNRPRQESVADRLDAAGAGVAEVTVWPAGYGEPEHGQVRVVYNLNQRNLDAVHHELEYLRKQPGVDIVGPANERTERIQTLAPQYAQETDERVQLQRATPATELQSPDQPKVEKPAVEKERVEEKSGTGREAIIQVDDKAPTPGTRGQAEAVREALVSSGARVSEVQSTVDEQGKRHSEIQVAYRTDQPEIARVSKTLDAVARQEGNQVMEQNNDRAERREIAKSQEPAMPSRNQEITR